MMICLGDYWLSSSRSPFRGSLPGWGANADKMDEADLSGRRILLVEDELLLAIDVEHSLDEAGAQTIGPASRLRDAVAIAADLDVQIDAAILDVDLHGQDVFPVADALRARGVPFLFHTGHGTKAGLNERYFGAVVCSKPILSEHLVAMVARLLK